MRQELRFLHRVEDDVSGFTIRQYTIAELIRAAGLFVPVGAGESARSVEAALERRFLVHQLTM